MNIAEVKDLMAQFDGSSLREFSYSNNGEELRFSKNEQSFPPVPTASASVVAPNPVAAPVLVANADTAPAPLVEDHIVVAEGELVESPLVGVAYLASAPEKPAFVSVGDTVKKGQTLLIIEAMKVMNEIPAPHDGVVTEILVDNEEIVEFGQGLVRIK